MNMYGIAKQRASTNLVKTRLIDWQVVRVPGVDAWLRNVHNTHADPGALVSNNGHSGPADVSRADAAYFEVFKRW